MPEAERSALLSLFSVVVVDLIGFGVVIPILPFLAESFGASATVLGVLLTCYAGIQFLFAPVWGRISDRVGRRPVMLATIAGTSLALLALGLADSLVWLFAARLLGGLFSANVSVATAYVGDLTKGPERTRWMGLIGVAFAIGFTLGPALGGLLAPFGYHVPMLAAAALAAINFFYALAVLREPPALRAAEGGGKLLRLPPPGIVRRLCAAYFVFTFSVSQLETVFAFFMMDSFAYDAREVAYILVMMALVMAAVQGGAIRRLAAAYGERRLLFAGASLLALSFTAVPWMPSVALLLVPLAVAAVGRALCHPSLLALVSGASTPRDRGLVMGVFQSSASLARVLGPLAAGALYDHHRAAPYLLAGALMVPVAAMTAALPSPRAA
jgi:DHA1 family tetracycline resistance protein-like MFS transporter